MLDTRFPRLPGDVGHETTFRPDTRRAVVHGAWPDKVVGSAASLRAHRLVEPFAAVVRQLERAGAGAITTSCGFLVLLQKELQASVRVPVVTSSLLLLPGLLQKQDRVGVLTISVGRLGREHLRAAGVPHARLGDVVVQGIEPGGAFVSSILGNQVDMDVDRAQAEVVAAALALRQRAPDLSTVVLECTNLPPHAGAIRRATGLTVLGLADHPVIAPYRGGGSLS